MGIQFGPYIRLARLDKPWGIVLLAWPTLSALVLTKASTPSLWILFIAGILLTRSAGCVFNDYADMWLDAKVSRTAQRPLVTGQVSPNQALIFFVCLMLSAATLLWFLPFKAQLCGLLSGILLSIYPYTKRYISTPQLFLGLVFSQGIPMAYLSTNTPIGAQAILFYAIVVLWVIIYDTIYALTDYQDDIHTSVGSTAIALGSYVFPFIQYGYIILILSWLLWGLTLNGFFHLFLIPLAHNLYQQLKFVKQSYYFKAFLLNQSAGLYILIGIIVSSYQ
nr:4-hydroxybenzoate octaprenyltransferase [Candidatus Synchoanobacter obligatus]